MVEAWYDYDLYNERSVNGNGQNFLPSIFGEADFYFEMTKPTWQQKKDIPRQYPSIKNEFNLIEKTRRTTRTENIVSRNLIKFGFVFLLACRVLGNVSLLFMISACFRHCRRAWPHRQQCRVFINSELVSLGTFWKQQSLSPTINWNISFIISLLTSFSVDGNSTLAKSHKAS